MCLRMIFEQKDPQSNTELGAIRTTSTDKITTHSTREVGSSHTTEIRSNGSSSHREALGGQPELEAPVSPMTNVQEFPGEPASPHTEMP